MRTWKFPDKRDGTVICIVTDTHFGYRNWTPGEHENTGLDLDFISPYVDAFLHGGDGIHWGHSESPENSLLKTWMDERELNTSIPWHMVPGNHDYSSFNPPYPFKTSTQWASILNRPPANSYMDIKNNIRIIGLGASTWSFELPNGYGPMTLSSADIQWLKTTVESTNRYCWVLCHVPLPEHYSGHLTPSVELVNVLSNHSNIMGWVSGHRHHNINHGTNNTKVMTYGTNKLFALNCPCSGGHTLSTDSSTPWDDILIATIITIRRDSSFINIKWRGLTSHTWKDAEDGAFRELFL